MAAWNQALTAAHEPEGAADLEADTPARSRLAYDELLANQLALALVRRSARGGRGRSSPATAGSAARSRLRFPSA